MSNLSQFSGKRLPFAGGLKSSLVLFEAVPGTRTWTCPQGVSRIRVFAVGGGADGTTSAGGGGGGFAEKTLDVTPGTSYTYVVGTTGGTSSFSTVCSATGASGATGGQGISGDLLANGGTGGSGKNSGGGGAGSRMGAGGNGGTGGIDGGAGGGGIGGGHGSRSYVTAPGNGGNGQGELWGTGIVVTAKAASGFSSYRYSDVGVTAFNQDVNGHPGCGGAGAGFMQNNGGQYPLVGGNGGIGAGGGGAASHNYSIWNGSSHWYYRGGVAGNGGIGGGGGGTYTGEGGGDYASSTYWANFGTVGKGGTGCVGIEILF